ncbi:EthD domain-containing protein [Phyllosticta citriasiana]|uniref:EthD domain-containing protein n=2 Tax=Phyllosticta TaxID=121621 RepID=A0ABR1K997_9PEZI
MVLEAGYPNTSGFRKVTKATILIKKKEGMSDQDFIAHYNHRHAQMAAPVLLRHGIISYSLTYHLHRDRTMMQDILKGNAKLMDYDAICTFVFPDYKHLAKFLYDKDSKALTSDHDNFMDDSQMTMMVGDEYVIVENGVKVDGA